MGAERRGAIKVAGQVLDRSANLAGYQMHIAKPLEAPELIAAIASLKHLARAR